MTLKFKNENNFCAQVGTNMEFDIFNALNNHEVGK
jgi:hypothetical protein